MVKNEENAKKRCSDVKCILLQAHTTIFVQFVPTFNGNTIIYNLQSQIFTMISATEGNSTQTSLQGCYQFGESLLLKLYKNVQLN